MLFGEFLTLAFGSLRNATFSREAFLVEVYQLVVEFMTDFSADVLPDVLLCPAAAPLTRLRKELFTHIQALCSTAVPRVDDAFALSASILYAIERLPPSNASLAHSFHADDNHVLASCTRRIANLEKELTHTRTLGLTRLQRAMAAIDESTNRLSEVNRLLEHSAEKKNVELENSFGQQLIDAQRGLDHAAYLLEDKMGQIGKLEQVIEAFGHEREEALRAQTEHRMRRLRLALRYSVRRQQCADAGENACGKLVHVDTLVTQERAKFEDAFRSRDAKFEAVLTRLRDELNGKRFTLEKLTAKRLASRAILNLGPSGHNSVVRGSVSTEMMRKRNERALTRKDFELKIRVDTARLSS
eukprot:GEMP01040970.1.p1 GENE.GEMP01040970.1~~GEMP01040970.1.p1  ORF type:complete len:357 (+),score=108.51 GEMP01040970.1:329-1399(+)